MNGAVDYLLSEEVIHLTRGPSGLGFNIVGGTDQQYIPMTVASTLAGSKKMELLHLMVNDQELKNMLHKNVVELFRTAGDNVSLKVQHRLLPQNGPSSHRGDGDPGGVPLAMILVPGLAIAAAGALLWAFLRYRQRV
ncbi:hypothetical protein E2320_021215 [Naja naja]|nr:hypothetical protein E2320_021215 [Naja naja]